MRRSRKKITAKTTSVTYDGEFTNWKGYNFKGKLRNMPTLAMVKKDLWDNYCTKFVKDRDGHKCISCGAYCDGWNRQGGHFEPKASGGAILYFHPHNVHVQCGGCNANEGNRTEYFPAMEKLYGRDYVEFLISLKHHTVQGDTLFYEKIRQYYVNKDEQGLADWLNSL